jgi:hypothetical protein
VLASLLICWQLKKLHGLPAPAVGMAVGEHVFCGVIGGRTRREYRSKLSRPIYRVAESKFLILVAKSFPNYLLQASLVF